MHRVLAELDARLHHDGNRAREGGALPVRGEGCAVQRQRVGNLRRGRDRQMVHCLARAAGRRHLGADHVHWRRQPGGGGRLLGRGA